MKDTKGTWTRIYADPVRCRATLHYEGVSESEVLFVSSGEITLIIGKHIWQQLGEPLSLRMTLLTDDAC